MTQAEIRARLCAVIDAHAEELYAAAREIYAHPELGYCEEHTSAVVRAFFEKYGIPYTYPHAKTGVKARLGNNPDLPTVAVMGELDAIRCAAHPDADKFGTVHACGHFAQITAMLGAALALKESGIASELAGNVAFLACPAEEFADLDTRRALREAGEIAYFGGKQQLISEGVFDGIDCAMLIHAQPNEAEKKLYVRGHNLGFLTERVTFRGKAAHGSKPYEGTNALNAAALFLLGIHANRETFRDEEHIRIHPIITKGGDVVNSVPDEVIVEMYVRGATREAIGKGKDAVLRAAQGAALTIGASVEFEETVGYLPIAESPALSQVMEDNASALGVGLVFGEEITGSTDIGDLSAILPVIQPSVGGFAGGLHSAEFAVRDRETAILTPAKLYACTVADLLTDNAEKLRAVKASFTPTMTKEQYLDYLKGK